MIRASALSSALVMRKIPELSLKPVNPFFPSFPSWYLVIRMHEWASFQISRFIYDCHPLLTVSHGLWYTRHCLLYVGLQRDCDIRLVLTADLESHSGTKMSPNPPHFWLVFIAFWQGRQFHILSLSTRTQITHSFRPRYTFFLKL